MFSRKYLQFFKNSFFLNTPGGCFWISKNMIIKYMEIEIQWLKENEISQTQ